MGIPITQVFIKHEITFPILFESPTLAICPPNIMTEFPSVTDALRWGLKYLISKLNYILLYKSLIQYKQYFKRLKML